MACAATDRRLRPGWAGAFWRGSVTTRERYVPPRLHLRLVAWFLLGILAASPAVADLWYEHYAKGEDALKAQNWNQAIEQLTQAIEKKGEPGVGVRTYGMNFINYHPYLKLGIAYYNLNQLDAAIQAFSTEENLGAIQKSPADLKALRDFRQKAQDAKGKAAAVEAQRITAIVAKGLGEARELQQQGKLEEAITALGKVLAIDKENEQASSIQARLRELIVSKEKERDAESRVGDLLAEGRSLIVSGKYQEASSVLSQAISLKATPEARSLLDQSQQRLREEIEATQNAQQRRELVLGGLAEAARLESQGLLTTAIEKLQTVLALDPQNHEAQGLQERLVRAQAEAESRKAKGEELARLLSEGETWFKSGDFDKSLAAFNRMITLDPTNPDAI